MRSKCPWWADPRLTDRQKEAYADRLAETFAAAWLATARPPESLVRAARLVVDSPPTAREKIV